MITPVILCGGSGSRLWPLSREKCPKQLLKLIDEDVSMFQYTLIRVNKLKPKNIIVICNTHHVNNITKEINELKLEVNITIAVEPIGRNTAAAVSCACLLTDEMDDLLVVPSDHVFDDTKFLNCIISGLKYTNDSIVTFGRKPTSPETGYGYIKRTGICTIDSFKEKPNLELAKQYLEDGNYLWNSGVFLFKNNIMTAELLKNAPDIYRCVDVSLNQSLKNKSNDEKQVIAYVNIDLDTFVECRDESIDYAVMEHIKNGVVVEYDGYWSDIGSYYHLYEHLEKDENNNVLQGENNNIMIEDVKNSYIRTDGHLIAAIGLDNVVIVKTKDCVLVASKDRSQCVKKIVKRLKEMKRSEAITHLKVGELWGSYTILNDTPNIKKFNANINTIFSLCIDECQFDVGNWFVTSGSAIIKNLKTTEILIVSKNDSISIPFGDQMEITTTDEFEFIQTLA